MSSSLSAQYALKHAQLLVDRPTIDRAIITMAASITKDYQGDTPVYISIMHGALPFAGQLAVELGTHGQDLQFDYLHATRYHGEAGGELIWQHCPITPLSGRRVLLIDDVLDEGLTLREVQTWCLEKGAIDARIAVLAVKQHDRCISDVKADYFGVVIPDRYVFGFGMDINEQLRSLPGIYTLKEETK